MNYRIVIEPQGRSNFKWWIEEDLTGTYVDFKTWIQVIYKDKIVLQGYARNEKVATKKANKLLNKYKSWIERDKLTIKWEREARAQRRYIDA